MRNGFPCCPQALKSSQRKQYWGGVGGDGDLEVGGNLEIDSQNQGWKGFREAFGLFPAFGQNLGLSMSVSISDKDS